MSVDKILSTFSYSITLWWGQSLAYHKTPLSMHLGVQNMPYSVVSLPAKIFKGNFGLKLTKDLVSDIQCTLHWQIS